MKKVIITLAMLALAAGAALAQPSVGVAYLNSEKTAQYKDNDPDKYVGGGFALGANYGIEVLDFLKVVPGIYFGHVTTNSAADILGVYSGTGTENENFLMFPIKASAGYQLIDALRVFAFAGPTFSYCIGSKSRYTATVTGLGSGETIVDNFEDSDYKRFDAMIGIGAGFDVMDMVRVFFSYDLGLLNLDGRDDWKLHRNQMSFGVAYLF